MFGEEITSEDRGFDIGDDEPQRESVSAESDDTTEVTVSGDCLPGSGDEPGKLCGLCIL